MISDWSKIYINDINENYYLRINGIAVKKPYKKEFALVWNKHYQLTKRLLNYKRNDNRRL